LQDTYLQSLVAFARAGLTSGGGERLGVNS